MHMSLCTAYQYQCLGKNVNSCTHVQTHIIISESVNKKLFLNGQANLPFMDSLCSNHQYYLISNSRYRKKTLVREEDTNMFRITGYWWIVS